MEMGISFMPSHHFYKGLISTNTIYTIFQEQDLSLLAQVSNWHFQLVSFLLGTYERIFLF